MGYYTKFTLKWTVTTGEVAKLNREIEDFLEENSDTYYGIEPDGRSADECKWYDHEKDMVKLSNLFPSVLFEMEGEGEESDDQWRRYYLAGKCQYVRAKIVFDDYDPTKLE